MNRAERLKAFADCDQAAAKVADPTTGRFDLCKVRAYLKREMKTRLMGVKPEEFIKLHKEERAKKLEAALEAREDTIDGYIEDAADSLVTRWDRGRRVKLEKPTFLPDALIPLDDNIRITLALAGPSEWTIYYHLLDDQVTAQVQAANLGMEKIRALLGDFKDHPEARTTEDLFSRMGRKFGGPESKAA